MEKRSYHIVIRIPRFLSWLLASFGLPPVTAIVRYNDKKPLLRSDDRPYR